MGIHVTYSGEKKQFELDVNGSGGELLVNILYKDLLELVTKGKLAKGQRYRITDYVATVINEYEKIGGFEAKSNNHAFDIIVTADTESVLNENAKAIKREGDTYFPDSVNLSAWELKYSIHNDALKYNWADNVNGKGVVYWMKDDNNNELPYDFKSIQFKRGEDWKYTFNSAEGTDDSLNTWCFSNKMDYNVNTSTFAKVLNNNVFGPYCYTNVFGYYSHSNTLGFNCYSNTFKDVFFSNILGDETNSNTFASNIKNKDFSSKLLQNSNVVISINLTKICKIFLNEAGNQAIELI